MGIASRGEVNYQRAKLQAIKDTGSKAIQVAFAQAHMTMSPEVAKFVAMYTQELQRVRSAAIHAGTYNEDEDESTGEENATVSILWLHQSGALKRLTDIVQKATTEAADASQKAAQAGVGDAQALGTQSATTLIKQAQPPAKQASTKVQQPAPAQQKMSAAQMLAALLQMDSGATGSQAAQATAKAVTAGLAAGVAGMVMQQLAFQGLQTALTSLLLGSGNAIQGAFNQTFGLTITANGSIVNGWYWQCTFDNSCTACILMDGSLHDNSETLDSHISCACLQVPYSGPPIDGMQTGDQRLNAASDEVQQAVLGPSKYLAWKSGDIQLMDLLDTREGFVEERSLKSLGLDARDYLQTLPTASERLEMQRALVDATEDLREVAPPPEWEMVLPKLPEIEPGNTRGYQILDDDGKGAVRIKELTGRDMMPDEIGGLVGAQKGDFVTLHAWEAYPDGDPRVSLTLQSPDSIPGNRATGTYNAVRTLYRDSTGALVMENESFGISDVALRGQGLGARIFGEEVQNLSDLGVARIDVGASGSAAELLSNPRYAANGFYTWARFGYDTPLADLADEGLDLDKLHEAFPGVETLQDLMIQPGGPEYWRANGVSFRGTFDLKEGSISHQILDAYLQDKGIVIEPLAKAPEVAPAAELAGSAGEGASKLTYTLPEIDQEAEQQVLQQVQDVLSGDGIASHTDAIDIGSQIDSYIDDRLGPLADYAQDATAIYNNPTDLSGEQIAWYAGDTSQHGGLTMEQALQQYQEAKRQEVVRLLSQVRDVGGTDLELAAGTPAELEDAIRSAQDVLPTDWLEASNADGSVQVVTGDARRAFYRSSSLDGNGTIALRPSDDPGSLYTAAVHELGHRMEDSVDGVWQMEQAFYNARTADEDFTALPAALKVVGRTKKDDFASPYLGKDPIQVVRAARAVDASGNALGTVYHYELLSSGLEWLLGTDYRGPWFLSKDEEYRHLIMGILFGAKGGAA
jgi:hypothetical protein